MNAETSIDEIEIERKIQQEFGSPEIQSILDDKKIKVDEMREKNRFRIALIFVWVYAISIVLSLGIGFWFVFSTDGKVDTFKEILITTSGIIGPPLSIILGFYFNEKLHQQR